MNPCYRCPSIRDGACLTGQKCGCYDARNVRAEVNRRAADKAKRLRAARPERMAGRAGLEA